MVINNLAQIINIHLKKQQQKMVIQKNEICLERIGKSGIKLMSSNKQELTRKILDVIDLFLKLINFLSDMQLIVIINYCMKDWKSTSNWKKCILFTRIL